MCIRIGLDEINIGLVDTQKTQRLWPSQLLVGRRHKKWIKRERKRRRGKIGEGILPEGFLGRWELQRYQWDRQKSHAQIHTNTYTEKESDTFVLIHIHTHIYVY